MKQIRVIINPAAGKDIPVLSILNDEFGSKVDWDAQITHGPGDASRLGEKAIAEGVDLVAVYGGDGTVSEVAASLAGRGVEMAILPGGTGNGVARFLELPLGLREAAALLSTDYSLRPLDLGRVNNRNFILRADLGFMEGVDQATTRFSKDHLGKWAYVLTSVRHPSLLTPTHYTLTIDGEDIDVEAVTILIINTGAVQFGHRAFVSGSSPDDGFLDLLVLTRRDALALLEVAGAVFLGTHTPMQRWKVKSVMIRTNPEQPVALDGEIVTSTPAMVEIVPHAVNVVVPRHTGLPVVQGRV